MTASSAQTSHDDAPAHTSKSPKPESVQVERLSFESGDALVGRSVTIDRPREQLYDFWRNFANLPRFMHNILEVHVLDATHSHWVVAGPAGKNVEWRSVITADQPGRLIAWESEPDASVRNSGTVEFKDSPERRGTVVTVTISYDPPAGAVGQLIARLFQKEPRIQARRDLRRFKQLMETGEVATAAPPDAAPRA